MKQSTEKSLDKEDKKIETQGALRYDSDKPRMDLLSPIALEGTAQILTFGAKKYAANNWRKGMDWNRCISSAMRHLNQFQKGEDYDPESGLPHLDHLACNIMFLQEYFRTHKHLDNRYILPEYQKKDK